MDDIGERLAAVQDGLISKQIVYFPIRHHSPVCGWQIRNWIRKHRPRAVLIEGPDNFQPLIPHLLHPGCEPPVAIYTHYRLGGKRENQTDQRHAAYYPFSAYSPEWVALREGHAVGAELRFIDLDYPSQRRTEEEAESQALQIESLQEELHYRRSAYLREVGRRLGCRNHDELWDHLVEIPGLSKSPEDVIRDVAAYCFFARLDSSPETLAADGTTAREAAMASAIAETLKAGGPVLVVTGGFHTIALPQLVATPPPQPKRHQAVAQQACLTRYTFAQLDSLTGYSAGMPDPGYYQMIWEALEKNEPSPLDTVSLRMLVDLGQLARRRDLSASVSVADEIAALEQAKRLAQMRNHRGPGREDLWDALRSCLVKGELGPDSTAILSLARCLFTGQATGKVPAEAGVPPLVEDFRRVAKEQKLPVEFGATHKLALEIYRKEQHRKSSRFLHRLAFLEVPYGERRAGPDFLNGTDLGRIIEHWDCHWTPQTESRLIEASAYGSSLEEATSAKLAEIAAKLDDESAGCAASGVALLIRGCLMGLPGAAALLTERLGEWITRDPSFISVARAFAQLVLLSQSRQPLDATQIAALPELIRIAYIRACELLFSVRPAAEEIEPTLDGSLLIHSRLTSENEESGLDPELFHRGLENLLAPQSPPLLRGAATGLLHSRGQMPISDVVKLIRGALAPAVEEAVDQVGFLVGLLKTARELAWQESALLEAIESLLGQWDEEEFLVRLPHLRLAWSDFTPRETDQVAALIALQHGVGKSELTMRSAFSETDVALALGVFARASQALREDGLESWLEVNR